MHYWTLNHKVHTPYRRRLCFSKHVGLKQQKASTISVSVRLIALLVVTCGRTQRRAWILPSSCLRLYISSCVLAVSMRQRRSLNDERVPTPEQDNQLVSASRPCDDPRRGCFDAPDWLLTFVRARNVLSIPLRAARLAMSYLIENTPYHLCHTDRIDYSKFELSARVHDGWDWGTTGSTAATGVGSKTETRLESTEAARRRRGASTVTARRVGRDSGGPFVKRGNASDASVSTTPSRPSHSRTSFQSSTHPPNQDRVANTQRTPRPGPGEKNSRTAIRCPCTRTTTAVETGDWEKGCCWRPAQMGKGCSTSFPIRQPVARSTAWSGTRTHAHARWTWTTRRGHAWAPGWPTGLARPGWRRRGN